MWSEALTSWGAFRERLCSEREGIVEVKGLRLLASWIFCYFDLGSGFGVYCRVRVYSKCGGIVGLWIRHD